MDILEKIKKAEKYETELKAKISLLSQQAQKLLAECGYATEQEALEEYKKLQEKLPEYEQKLDNYLSKVKEKLGDIDEL